MFYLVGVYYELGKKIFEEPGSKILFGCNVFRANWTKL